MRAQLSLGVGSWELGDGSWEMGVGSGEAVASYTAMHPGRKLGLFLSVIGKRGYYCNDDMGLTMEFLDPNLIVICRSGGIV